MTRPSGHVSGPLTTIGAGIIAGLVMVATIGILVWLCEGIWRAVLG